MRDLAKHLPRLVLASCPYEITPELGLFAAVTLKSCTLHPVEGPCLFEEVSPHTFMNRWGLDNPGLDVVLHNVLPKVQAVQDNIILSAFFTGLDEVKPFCTKIANQNILAIELNISCPNKDSVSLTHAILEAVRQLVPSQMFIGLKIGPHFPIVELAHTPVDFVTFSNTLPFAHETFGSGGLSGLPLRAHVVEKLPQLREAFDGTIIACGGVSSAQDYKGYLSLGADYVALASQYLKNKNIVTDILFDLGS